MERRILIVDDEPEFFNGLVEELEARDCVVVSLNNIKNARLLIKDQQARFDLILVDLVFGENGSGKQGLSFISWLQDEKVDSKIIIVTIHQSHKTVYVALKEKRVDDYFFKSDYEIDVWVEKIIDLMDLTINSDNGSNLEAHDEKILEPHQILEESERLVILTKVQKGIDLLRTHPTVLEDQEINREISQQESRWQKLSRDIRNGTISKAEADKEHNEIVRNLLDIIANIKNVK